MQCYQAKEPLLSTCRKNWNLLLGRALCQGSAVFLCIVSVQNLPLSVYAIIEELAPLFTLIIGLVLLRECIMPLEMLLGLSVFVGVVLVIQPPVSFLHLWSSENYGIERVDYVYVFFAVMSVVFLSCSKVLVRKMNTKSRPVPLAVTTISAALTNIFIGITYHFYSYGWTWLTCIKRTQSIYLILNLLLAATNQFFGYFALKFKKAPIFALIATMKVPILFIFDIFIYPEMVQDYNLLQYIGGVTVFLSILSLIASSYFKFDPRKWKANRKD